MTDPLLIINNKIKISYRLFKGKPTGVVFLNGFMSNKNNIKCLSVEQYCQENKINFICFDYYGHGKSTGNCYDVTIGNCIESTIQVIDNLTDGPQLLVASSMGGWIMNLVAQARKARIAGMIGFANAPDFTKHLMWDTFSPAIKEKIVVDKVWESQEFPITYQLLAESKQHLILHKKFNFKFPIILLHGKKDIRVPFEYSVRLLNCYNPINSQLKLITGATHSFHRPCDIKAIINSIEQLRS